MTFNPRRDIAMTHAHEKGQSQRSKGKAPAKIILCISGGMWLNCQIWMIRSQIPGWVPESRWQIDDPAASSDETKTVSGRPRTKLRQQSSRLRPRSRHQVSKTLQNRDARSQDQDETKTAKMLSHDVSTPRQWLRSTSAKSKG